MFTRPDSRDAPHLFGLGLQEMLGDEMTTELRGQRDRAMASARQQRRDVTVALVAKGTRYGTLIARANGTVDTSGVAGVDTDLRVRPFFAQGGTFSIRQFVVGAFNDEMGLQAPDPDTATPPRAAEWSHRAASCSTARSTTSTRPSRPMRTTIRTAMA